MILLPYIQGFYRPGEKQETTSIFICTKCNAKRTVKDGKTIPTCSRYKEQTYWYKAVDI